MKNDELQYFPDELQYFPDDEEYFSDDEEYFYDDEEYYEQEVTIEKACEWLEKHLLEYWPQINGNNIEEFIEQFRKAMEE